MTWGYRNWWLPFQSLREEMDRLLAATWPTFADRLMPVFVRGQPLMNVWEKDDAVMVEMELPGVKSEQLDISVVGNELSVKVDQPDTAKEGVTYHRRERPVGKFTRVVRLPTEVDAGRVEAELRNGVLTITLPKSEKAKPRRITVAAAS
jgi:HSP20 family protein